MKLGGGIRDATPQKKATIAFAFFPPLILLALFFSVPSLMHIFSPPNILSASVEPQKVRPGDIMLVSVQVIDQFGIREVTADMGGIETIHLGYTGEGLWQATWRVHSTGLTDYTTTIKATNIFGLSSYFEVTWSDPVYYTWTTNSDWQTGTFANTTADGGDLRLNWTRTYDNWLYRKPVSIFNSGSALTNYQVNVTVDTSVLIAQAKMQTDCRDVRFTGPDGASQFNYWIESGCNSASTIVWVNVSSAPAGSSTIYMYYGNPSATSASHLTNTFGASSATSAIPGCTLG